MSTKNGNELTAKEEQEIKDKFMELDKINEKDMTQEQMKEYLELCGLVFEGPEMPDEYWLVKTVRKERAKRAGRYDEDFFTKRVRYNH